MSRPDRLTEERTAAVLARLSRVSDPELDEPVTELGFITDIEIDDAGLVQIGFRLPTYWCAANFAFMMADDMRREVAGLPWVTRVAPRLGEHMYAEKINDGVQRELSFEEVFRDTSEGAAPVGNLDQLRRTFLIKAFQRRQEVLLRHLLVGGQPAGAVVALTINELAAATTDSAGEILRIRYLDRRAMIGESGPHAPAFVDEAGVPLTGDGLTHYLRTLSRVNVGAEFNGALCRGLLAARFNEPVIEPGDRPGLQHFVRAAARSLGKVA